MNQEISSINIQNKVKTANKITMLSSLDLGIQVPGMVDRLDSFRKIDQRDTVSEPNKTIKFNNKKNGELHQENSSEEMNSKTQVVIKNFKQVHKADEMIQTSKCTKIEENKVLSKKSLWADTKFGKIDIKSQNYPITHRFKKDETTTINFKGQITKVSQDIVQSCTESEFNEAMQSYSRKKILQLKNKGPLGDGGLELIKECRGNEVKK